MNHTRNAIRFAIMVFWIVVIGLFYTVIMNSGNAHVLGWVSWLFYAVVTVMVLYVGIVFSIKLWNVK